MSAHYPTRFQGYQPLNDAPISGWQQYERPRYEHQASFSKPSNGIGESLELSYTNKSNNPESIPLTSTGPPNNYAYPKSGKLSRRCRCDCAALTLVIFVWLLISASVGGFILLTRARRSQAGWVDAQAVTTGFGLLLGLSAIAATLNEALIDRVWRKIKTNALRGAVSAHNIRASNFQILDCSKRMLRGRASRREVASFLSNGILRWGTVAAFSTLQLTVHITKNPDNPDLFLTQIQTAWVPVPLVLHIFCVFAALGISGLPPWALLFTKYDERVVLEAYEPYLKAVPFGSAATSEQVADFLEKSSHGTRDFSSLAVDHEPGLQLRKKIAGTTSGTLMMIIIPTILYFYQRFADKEGIAVARFLYSFGLSLFATGYTFSQNFVIWTLGLEGITSSPRSDTNRLGTTSGLMLLNKAIRQRRPVRVFLLYWVFWLHALVFRLYIFCFVLILSIHKVVPEAEEFRQTLDDMRDLANFFWPVALWIFVVPPYILWYLVPFKAPLGPLDGWRVSKILEGATRGKGRYGVEGPENGGMAKWGLGTRVFKKERLL